MTARDVPAANPSPLATVRTIYEAFGRGDVPAILGLLAPDVRWEAWDDNLAQRAGVPWMQARTGPDGAAGFFRAIAEWRIADFRVLDLLGNDRQVAAEVRIDATVTTTGARIVDEEMHLWTFDDRGRVVRFRHYTDTARHLRAAGLAAPAD